MTSYNGKAQEPKEIAVEVVPPAPAPTSGAQEKVKPFFHPLSGLTIVLVDWLAFGVDVPSGLLLTAATSTAAFAVTFSSIYWIERREAKDGLSSAVLKALFGAIAAGVPFPVTGTIVGTGILLLSGLPLLGPKK